MTSQQEADFWLWIDQTRRKLEKQRLQLLKQDNETDLYVSLLRKIAKEMEELA